MRAQTTRLSPCRIVREFRAVMIFQEISFATLSSPENAILGEFDNFARRKKQKKIPHEYFLERQIEAAIAIVINSNIFQHPILEAIRDRIWRGLQ